MDRTNILQVFDEVSQAMEDTKLSINFSKVTDSLVDEPSVKITALAENNISVDYYLTAEESQEITKDELENVLKLLIKQEHYRRTLIFRSAVITNTQVKEK